jgi:SSS family solute:Na+ symporter
VYTDVIQAVILLIGSTAITWLALEQIGSWESMIEQTPPEMLSLVRPLDDPTMPWLGLLTGVPILGFYFWCTNQFIVQRVLGAKDTDNARWGSLLAGLLKLPVLYIMVFPGVMARFIFPDLPRADLVFPTMVTELLPVGLRGLVIAGLVAAIMSSIDSTLHSASTLVTMDFVKKWRPHISANSLTKVGRTVTLCFMVFSALWTPVVARFSTLFEYLQSALAFLVPPVAAVFFLGVFWSRANSKSVMTALIGSHAFSISVLTLRQLSWFPEIHFLIWAFVFFLTALFLMVTVSLLSPTSPTVEQSSFTLSRSSIKEIFRSRLRQPLWTDYRLQSIALLGLTAWMVLSYW